MGPSQLIVGYGRVCDLSEKFCGKDREARDRVTIIADECQLNFDYGNTSSSDRIESTIANLPVKS